MASAASMKSHRVAVETPLDPDATLSIAKAAVEVALMEKRGRFLAATTRVRSRERSANNGSIEPVAVAAATTYCKVKRSGSELV